MRTAHELKAKSAQVRNNEAVSMVRQEMIDGQVKQLVACIHDFFDENDACGPVCYLNELMKSRADNAEGLRISSFLMQLERFNRSFRVLQTGNRRSAKS
ncbi:hypothetical protein [Dyadobacter sp. CY326]|uniref:hypothetical protein n=1 Tax=Dyadobacter sp. CY326 TaxID=2907300 RepID=UPI001F32CA29|nr:hypothetical protein [Dyadobacter sp. CY326]MCE7063818.1 hypothetical protein [Dyadobacter sp. CY326]